MDSFELNKIAGAVLFALLVSFGLSIFSEIIFETEVPESPGYVIAVTEPAEGGEAGAPAATQPIGVLLASADAGAGEGSAKKCVACHSFAQGEANKVGPNLWEVVNRPVAGLETYEYSAICGPMGKRPRPGRLST
jgi:cytochrome c